MVFPVVLGEGKRLFGDTSDKKPLELADSKVVGDGVSILVYRRPRRSDGDAGAGGADADREGGVDAHRSGIGPEAGLRGRPRSLARLRRLGGRRADGRRGGATGSSS